MLSLMMLGNLKWSLLVELARKHGDPFTMPSMFGKVVVAVSPEGNRAIFSADPESLGNSIREAMEFVLGKSVLLTEGAEHRRARKLLSPPFHGQRMRAYGTLMLDTALRRTSEWQVGHPFKALDMMLTITLDMIIEAVFGVSKSSPRVHAFREQLVSLIEGFHPMLFAKFFRRRIFPPWVRFQRAYEALRQQIFALINENRSQLEGREDILSLLIKARDEQGQGLSDQEIMDQLIAILFGGHDTTAVTLSWSLYLLHRNPEALSRLRAELAALGSQPEPEAITSLPFLEAVLNETLRLYPPVELINRKLLRPLTLLGWELPAGTVVAAGGPATHRLETLYPEPDTFKPERFLARTYSPFEFMPWGGGNRRCLGAAFAMYEMKLVLAAILLRCELRLLDKGEVTLAPRAGTSGPKSGIHMELIARH
jgi:cytochrome P450